MSQEVSCKDIQNRNEEEERKLRALSYKIIHAYIRDEDKVDEKTQKKLKDLSTAINNINDERIRIYFRIDTYKDDSTIRFPAEIAKDLLVAYADMIESAVLKQIKELQATSKGYSYNLPIDCQYYAVRYEVTIRSKDLGSFFGDDKKIKMSDLEVNIGICCYAIVHKPPLTNRLIGEKEEISTSINLYHSRYRRDLLEKADKIVESLNSWYILVVKPGSKSSS